MPSVGGEVGRTAALPRPRGAAGRRAAGRGRRATSGAGPARSPGRALGAGIVEVRSRLRRRIELDDASWWCVLAGFGLAYAGVATLAPGLVPLAAALLLVLIGMVLTPPAYLLLDAAVVGAVVLAAIVASGRPVPWMPVLQLVMVGAIVLGSARHRQRAGVADKIGAVGEADAVLIDLRQQIRQCTAMPALPVGWSIEAQLRQAGEDRFGGDFVIATMHGPDRLDVVLVDVSGKGRAAGGRALLLAGAFAALLDAVPREEFLTHANRHVVRHGEEEAFATAVHVGLDLATGSFRVAAAGHPPAAQRHAGSGRWALLDAEHGLPLGVLPDQRYSATAGLLAPGDALMLYTDGLVESEGVDVSRGIDRLLGRAEQALMRACPPATSRSGVAGASSAIMNATTQRCDDDCGLVLLRRA